MEQVGRKQTPFHIPNFGINAFSLSPGNAMLAIGLLNVALLCSVTSGLVWSFGIVISDGNSKIYKASTAA